MIGAIIGDMAASTYERNTEHFFSLLIYDDIPLSSYGQLIVDTADVLVRNPSLERTDYERLISHNDNHHNPFNVLMRAIVVGWLYDTEEETSKRVQMYGLNDEKSEWYAMHFLSSLIFTMRNGGTKRRTLTVEHIGPFSHFCADSWIKDMSPLGYLVRAFLAFKSAFDFGSALHNAMKLPGDRHVNAILVGALADSMYGCSHYMIKKEFKGGCWLTIPKVLDTTIVQMLINKRSFCPKNSCNTNVERHHWKPIDNPYKDKPISAELRRRILKSFGPSWDYRYAFYFDDGWIYVYRSGFILSRFRIDKLKGEWYLTHLQIADGEKTDLIPIEEALYAVKYRWFWVSGENVPANLEFCKYYHGEDEMPNIIKDKVDGKFWYGEMMFVTNQIDMDDWKQSAQSCIDKLTGERKEAFSKYTPEQRAIIIYIETLYGKFCPYDDFAWIFKY